MQQTFSNLISSLLVHLRKEGLFGVLLYGVAFFIFMAIRQAVTVSDVLFAILISALAMIPLEVRFFEPLFRLFAVRCLRVEAKLLIQDEDVFDKLSFISDICTDKTGVLTHHMIRVAYTWLGGGIPLHVHNNDENINNAKEHSSDRKSISILYNELNNDHINGNVNELISNYPMIRDIFATAIALPALTNCSSLSKINFEEKGCKQRCHELFMSGKNATSISCNQTDVALLEWLSKYININKYYNDNNDNIVRVFSFDPLKRHSSVIIEKDHKQQLQGNNDNNDKITTNNRIRTYRQVFKGAPDVIMDHCTSYLTRNGTEEMITNDYMIHLNKLVTSMATSGLRVMSIAYIDLDQKQLNLLLSKPEQQGTFPGTFPGTLEPLNVVLVGLVGIEERMRRNAINAMSIINNNMNIKCHVLTGDHIDTALFVTSKCNIHNAENNNMKGWQFTRLSSSEKSKTSRELSVMARATPLDKLCFVSELTRLNRNVCCIGESNQDVLMAQHSSVVICLNESSNDEFKELSHISVLNDDWDGILRCILWGRHMINVLRGVVSLRTQYIGLIMLSIVLYLGQKNEFDSNQSMWTLSMIIYLLFLPLIYLPIITFTRPYLQYNNNNEQNNNNNNQQNNNQQNNNNNNQQNNNNNNQQNNNRNIFILYALQARKYLNIHTPLLLLGRYIYIDRYMTYTTYFFTGIGQIIIILFDNYKNNNQLASYLFHMVFLYSISNVCLIKYVFINRSNTPTESVHQIKRYLLSSYSFYRYFPDVFMIILLCGHVVVCQIFQVVAITWMQFIVLCISILLSMFVVMYGGRKYNNMNDDYDLFEMNNDNNVNDNDNDLKVIIHTEDNTIPTKAIFSGRRGSWTEMDDLDDNIYNNNVYNIEENSDSSEDEFLRNTAVSPSPVASPGRYAAIHKEYLDTKKIIR